jgi:hypothetical protein
MKSSLFHDPLRISLQQTSLEILFLHHPPCLVPIFSSFDSCFIEDTAVYLPVSFVTGHTAQVCLLLKHRADQHLRDSEGVESLDIAVREANADIVTL